MVSTTTVTTPGTAPVVAPCAYRLPVPSAAPAPALVEGPFLGSTGPVTGGELRPQVGRRTPLEGFAAPGGVPFAGGHRERGDHQRPFPVQNVLDRTPTGGPDPGRTPTA
ncbi:hypothetical protein [Pseudokineococcus lusitanus]|uniref:Uncharacterized protein n=1 Tax=Pseudokineococcus lusitanus TaxID=763993 RepID=A0A3N1HN77_9ACTN|nr:hypothetical protein [Pseudokineococcus lusitanus]ROP43909.1 hypothetical protein EDC03_1506 [Pseudokineococcus lusitanus]